MSTGYWSYTTHSDGLCCFDTADEAVQAATSAANRDSEQVQVWTPDGDLHTTVGRILPTHEQRCMDPDAYGYED